MFNILFDRFMDGFMAVGDAVIMNIDKYSNQACLIIGLVALILAIFGYEKGKKIALLSPAVYVVLQIFLSVWFGI